MVDATNLPTIELSESRGLQPGQSVLAMGDPWRVRGDATAGGVIGVGSGLADISRSDQAWIAVSLSLRPTHTGGPLVDIQGGGH